MLPHAENMRRGVFQVIHIGRQRCQSYSSTVSTALNDPKSKPAAILRSKSRRPQWHSEQTAGTRQNIFRKDRIHINYGSPFFWVRSISYRKVIVHPTPGQQYRIYFFWGRKTKEHKKTGTHTKWNTGSLSVWSKTIIFATLFQKSDYFKFKCNSNKDRRWKNFFPPACWF